MENVSLVFPMIVSQLYYLVRSRVDGQYLAAQPRNASGDRPAPSYLLLFKEHADALSYLNTHGAEIADRFSVETMAGPQLSGLMNRWGYAGVGIVNDPLLPQVEFLTRQ